MALRKGTELLLQQEGLRVIGVAESAAEATPMILARRPDVSVVDIGLERGSGLDVASSVLSDWPDARLLLYTGGAIDCRTVQNALGSGVRGVALKAGPPAELMTAIRRIASGGTYVDPRLRAVLAKDGGPVDDGAAPHAPLTAREREVLELMALGLRTDEIAEQLVVAPVTVETHVRNLKRKLGARTRVHALALALNYLVR